MKRLTISAKSLALAVATITVMTLGQGVAHAGDLTIAGSSTGSILGVPQLTFAGNPGFTVTTVLGLGSLSGANSLGTFTLATDSVQTVVGQFTLNILFTTPTDIKGGQGAIYSATVFGSVSPNVDGGGVIILFPIPYHVFTFDDGTTDFFVLSLHDVAVQTGQTANLTAHIGADRNVPVPEPATLLLLGTGLTGIAAKLRKRRKLRAETNV